MKGALCPVGAICQRNSYAQPSSKAGFWKDALDITEGDETVVSRDEPLIEDDRMSKRALDDMKRALGESANSDDVRRPACAPERVLRIFSDMTDSSEVVPLDMEDQLKNRLLAENIYTEVGIKLFGVTESIDLSKYLALGYPKATRNDQCNNFVACQPNDACKAGNTCSDAYLHTLLKCQEYQTENPEMNSCTLTIQCAARQSGSECVQAIPNICRCPPQWELGSFACSKKCIREQRDSLKNAGCNVDQLALSLARLPPISTEFMNGAVCKKSLNAGLNGTFNGECTCVSSPRCALCTSGSYYRVSGECIPCPQHPEMIIGTTLDSCFSPIGFLKESCGEDLVF